MTQIREGFHMFNDLNLNFKEDAHLINRYKPFYDQTFRFCCLIYSVELELLCYCIMNFHRMKHF